MKKTTKIFGLLLTLFGLALVTGCTPITETPDMPEEKNYTVTIAENISNGTVTANKTSGIKAGETVTLTVTANKGYKLGSLSVKNGDAEISLSAEYKFTMPAANVTISATFEVIPPTTANYTVKHLQQNLDNDDYTEVTKDAQILNGTIGAQTTAEAKTYTGFTAQAFDQQTINADGTTVVEIKYDRNTYTVSYENKTGETLSATLPGSTSVKYGTIISVNPATYLNSTVAYIVWTDGTKDYNKDGKNTEFTITVNADVTLTAKELWFNAGTPVVFSRASELVSVVGVHEDTLLFNIDNMAAISLKELVSKTTICDLFESGTLNLYRVKNAGEDAYFTLDNEGTKQIFEKIELSNDCLKLYFIRPNKSLRK